jgi:hypothetical protein
MERMAFQQASSGHQKTLYHSVPFNCALGIHGAGGVKPACRSQQWREEGSVKHQETNAEASHNPGSPNWANRCLRKVLRHTCSNSAKGSVKHSRLGKTRIPYPGNKAGRTDRPISRKRRLARFRRTAVPNRRPITMPSIASENIPGQNCRLNHPVETRRPVFLIRSMSRLRLRKNDTGLCPCVMNSPACQTPSVETP